MIAVSELPRLPTVQHHIVHYEAREPSGGRWSDELDPSDGFRVSIGRRRALVLFVDRFQWHQWFLGRNRRQQRRRGSAWGYRARLIRTWLPQREAGE